MNPEHEIICNGQMYKTDTPSSVINTKMLALSESVHGIKRLVIIVTQNTFRKQVLSE